MLTRLTNTLAKSDKMMYTEVRPKGVKWPCPITARNHPNAPLVALRLNSLNPSPTRQKTSHESC